MPPKKKKKLADIPLPKDDFDENAFYNILKVKNIQGAHLFNSDELFNKDQYKEVICQPLFGIISKQPTKIKFNTEAIDFLHKNTPKIADFLTSFVQKNPIVYTRFGVRFMQSREVYMLQNTYVKLENDLYYPLFPHEKLTKFDEEIQVFIEGCNAAFTQAENVVYWPHKSERLEDGVSMSAATYFTNFFLIAENTRLGWK